MLQSARPPENTHAVARSAPRIVLLAVFALALVTLSRCSPAPARTARHLILVTVDTLRADHVGAYGSDVPTPAIDRLAATGATLEQVTAHVPLTRPSHVALLTGHLPTKTGIRDNVSPTGPAATPMLAEVLRDAGFTTGGFVSSVVVSAHGGFDRGFDTFSGDFDASGDDPSFLDSAYRRGDETLAEAVAWLREHSADDRIFLWLHLYDPHDPYEPPEPFASQFPDRPYAGEVAFADSLIDQLDEALESIGLRNDALVTVTSDHGEGLGDHGELLHGFFAYESTLHVPLIMSGPGVSQGVRIARPSGLVDLFPTLLTLLGLPAPEAPSDGIDLAAAVGGGPAPPPTPVYAESLVPLLHFGWSDLRVVRNGQYKYIQAPRPELYDLDADPHELSNVIDDARPAARTAIETLAGFIDDERAAIHESAIGPVPAALLEQLGALGYVGGSTADTATPGADPKDKIEAFRRASDTMRAGLRHLHAGEPTDAAIAFQNLLDNGIASAEIHLYLGRALLSLGRNAGAAAHFAETTLRAPNHVGAWLGLAEARAQLDDANGALQALRDGQAALADPTALQVQEGRLLRLLGDHQGARAVLEKVVARDAAHAHAHAMLGEVMRDLDQLDAAVAHLRTAVDIAPDAAAYWNALGMTLGGAGNLADAEPAFEKACRLNPENHRYAYNLGLLLLRLDRPDEAKPQFEKALAIEPGFTPAREQLEALATRSSDEVELEAVGNLVAAGPRAGRLLTRIPVQRPDPVPAGHTNTKTAARGDGRYGRTWTRAC